MFAACNLRTGKKSCQPENANLTRGLDFSRILLKLKGLLALIASPIRLRRELAEARKGGLDFWGT